MTVSLELLHQSDVFYSSALQIYGSLHVLRYRVRWKFCITAMCLFYSSVLQFYCLFQLRVTLQIAVGWLRQGVSKGTCFSVMSFLQCFASHCWQIALELLHQGCDLNARICTKQCVFSGKRMFRCEEMLARARDGVRRRRFAVESVSNFARIVTEGSR